MEEAMIVLMGGDNVVETTIKKLPEHGSTGGRN
jgi:hypothetical protein